MHFQTLIELDGNYELDILSQAVQDSFNVHNNIDEVLLNMVSVRNDFIPQLRKSVLFAASTDSLYFLFTNDNTTIRCTIEIHSDDATLASHLITIFSSLKNLEKKLKKRKLTSNQFEPVKIFERGNQTGLTITKKGCWERVINEFKTGSELTEVIAIAIAFFALSIYKDNSFIESLIPTFVVGLIVFALKGIIQIFSKDKIIINGASNE